MPARSPRSCGEKPSIRRMAPSSTVSRLTDSIASRRDYAAADHSARDSPSYSPRAVARRGIPTSCILRIIDRTSDLLAQRLAGVSTHGEDLRSLRRIEPHLQPRVDRPGEFGVLRLVGRDPGHRPPDPRGHGGCRLVCGDQRRPGLADAALHRVIARQLEQGRYRDRVELDRHRCAAELGSELCHQGGVSALVVGCRERTTNELRRRAVHGERGGEALEGRHGSCLEVGGLC